MRNIIFISVTHQLSSRQFHFLSLVNSFLKAYHFEAVTVGRNISSVGETIFYVRDTIEASRATLVIAFKKVEITSIAYEDPEFIQITEPSKRILASVWNHIEAAMTIQAKKPLLILCEKGVYLEGAFKWKTRSPLFFNIDDSEEHLPKNVTDILLTWIKSLEEN